MKNISENKSFISLPENFQENILIREIQLGKGKQNINTIYELIELYIVGN